jgi:hypothetical protein
MMRVTMNDAKTDPASTGSAPISDAEMAAVLANSSWAKMEREAGNACAFQEFREENFGESASS